MARETRNDISVSSDNAYVKRASNYRKKTTTLLTKTLVATAVVKSEFTTAFRQSRQAKQNQPIEKNKTKQYVQIHTSGSTSEMGDSALAMQTSNDKTIIV